MKRVYHTHIKRKIQKIHYLHLMTSPEEQE